MCTCTTTRGLGFVLLMALACAIASGGLAYAQKGAVLGPAKCTDCHDHDKHTNWWKKEDGTTKGGRLIRHINGLNRLEEANSAKYAKAIGLASADDVYAVTSSCVKCHATVYKGEARAGVSCESCHGGGSNYLDIHKEKGAYQKAVAAGMLDIIEKPQKWAPECIKCHVVDDQRLIDAKHPSGDDFDLTQKFQPVAKHWEGKYGKNTGYEAASIAAAGAAMRAVLVKKRGSIPSGAPTTTEGPPPPVSAPPPAAAPPPSPAPPTPSTTLPPSRLPSSSPPTVATTAGGTPSTTGGRPKAGGPTPGATTTTRGSPSSAPVLPPPPISPPTSVVPPPIVDRTGTPLPAPTQPAAPLPPTPAGIVASLQGRLVALLRSLLDSGARSPTRVVPPDQATNYEGADAELLRLQEEAIALALEALSVAPTTPATTSSAPKP